MYKKNYFNKKICNLQKIIFAVFHGFLAVTEYIRDRVG
jgi:hypothetical protein